ncbi:hypothetical protein AC1031_012762 [Aphanomyces cochlioides]|nr:hypothetical protein AC1031_012762 [Aphanomyces cochlioides]
MPTVVAKEDKKPGMMGRLKSKISTTLGGSKKKDTAPNEGDLSPSLDAAPSQADLCNQGSNCSSTPRLESSTDLEHHDDLDIAGDDTGNDSVEPRDDSENNEESTQDDVAHSPAIGDLVVVGKSPSKLATHPSPKKSNPFHPKEEPSNSPTQSFAPDNLIQPPETRRSTENLCPSPMKRNSVHALERLVPPVSSTLEEPLKPIKKTRALSSLENAPILASASAVVSEPADSKAADAPEVKTEHDFDAGAAITTVFGERVARLLGADPWGDRQDGFDAISHFVKKMDPSSNNPQPAAVLSAALAAINCGVTDRVAPVMYCSLECLNNVLTVFAPIAAKSKRFMQYPALSTHVAALQASLLAKLNDSNKRTQREAIQGLIRLAKAPRLQALTSLLSSFDAEPLDKSRLELIHDLVADIGYGEVGIDRVLAWTVPALKISDEKTRKLALDVAANAIVQCPDPTAALESIAGLKPAMVKVLQRRVEEIKSSQVAASSASTNQSEPAEPEEKIELWEVPKEDDASVTTLLATAMKEAEAIAGPVAWRKLESKTWSDRKEALVDIEKAVEEHKSDLRDVKPTLGSQTQRQYVAYNALIHHTLNDSIAPVVNQAIDFYATLVKIYGPHVDWRDTPVKDLTIQSIMRLLVGMQKPNNRTSKGSCRCILKLARLSVHTMACVIACVFAKEAEPLVQMHVLRLLVPEFGLTTDPANNVPGININSTLVLNAVATGLAHSNEKVRRSAMDVALCTQRLIGKAKVLQRLKDIKPSTLKELEKNFVDVEPPTVDRPATVTQPPASLGAGLGEVTASRRLLSSAPVAGGKALDDDGGAMDWTPRGDSILSQDEESFMNSILDG